MSKPDSQTTGHAFRPHPKSPWFCDLCGYARHVGLQHDQPPLKIRWEVFRNPDEDAGGWFSYVDDGRHYLGGDLFRTKADAELDAKHRVKKAMS